MQYTKILLLITCLVGLKTIWAYPQERFSLPQSQRLQQVENSADIQLPVSGETLNNLYKYERTLNRLRRALEQLDYAESADDMELAEINVFRPLFRYRAEVARQVKNPPQFG